MNFDLPTTLKLGDFDYELPPELIAQAPLAQRSASRLLVVGTSFKDSLVQDLPKFLNSGDLLIFNDSRVIHARLFGQKESGGQVEVMVERVVGEHEVLAMIRASKSPKPGSRLILENALGAEVLGRVGEFFHLRFANRGTAVDLLEEYGRLPLPPYIERSADRVDEGRYQTIYAKHTGSVAAPTAGLHFDDVLFAMLDAKGVQRAYVTLHVGAGTFQPVRVENLNEHQMHQEHYIIPQTTVEAIAATKARGGKIVCVGTTSLRALESAARSGTLRAGSDETRLFITPGYEFKVADRLLTNFHLPKSTLLMLVSAFAGVENMRKAYAHAIAEKYRFFSYGDAMLLSHV